MSAGSPSAPLESGHSKRPIFHRCLKLLTWKIFSGEVCLVVELLPLTAAFPHFARTLLCPQGTQLLFFTLLLLSTGVLVLFPHLLSLLFFFLIPALELPGLVTNAPSPLDCNRNAFSSSPSPVAKGWLINHVCTSLLSKEGERSNCESC